MIDEEFENKIKEYLKNNLAVDIDTSADWGNVRITVSVYLGYDKLCVSSSQFRIE